MHISYNRVSTFCLSVHSIYHVAEEQCIIDIGQELQLMFIGLHQVSFWVF